MSLRRFANLAAGTFFAFAFTLVFLLFLTVRLQAQCSDDYLKSIPPPAAAIGAVRVAQLINCTNQVLLGATNAAHQPNKIGLPIFPEEKTWVMQPFDPSNWNNHSNILTINIPEEWANTVCPVGAQNCVATGPVIWARTGCRYDITTNRAQCETGGCADQYDCSTTAHGNPPYITFTEWTFYQPTQKPGIFFDNFDVSAVNGASLTVDVQPLGGTKDNPYLPGMDWLWLAYNAELGMHGATDLRQQCGNGKSVSDGGFLLKRSDINTAGAPNFGFEIVDGNGNLACPKNEPNCNTVDNALGCLNNCGLYKFPHERGTIGCDQDDDNCLGWEAFCAGDPNLYPPPSFVCHTDDDCKTYAQQHGGKYGAFASCFFNSAGATSGFCAQRAFYAEDISNCDTLQTNGHYWGAPTKDVPCSFTYQSWNNLTQMVEWGTQPPYGMCSDVKGSGDPINCIGDDTIHQVLHGAYTWPNDPEVFTMDAPVYRVIYAPGYDPATSAPITPADTIPLCSDLPDNYNYSQNQINCSSQIKEGLLFTVANNLGQDWPCGVGQSSANDQGVLCRFRPVPPNGNCLPPIIDSDVTHSACGKIDTGTSLVATVPDNPSGFTPSAGDWLFVGITIPQVLGSVMPLGASPISGCTVNNWTAVPNGSLAINTSQGLLAWYYGRVQTSQPNGCQITMTLPSGNKNPAELKVYDVPQFSGMFDRESSLTGNFGNVGTSIVSAGQLTTTHAPDLLLGNLLQVNLQLSPATTWNPYLSNNPQQGQLQCLGSPAICPTDDAPDWLPGHGPYSANSDTGHQKLTQTGTYAFKYLAQASGQVNWGGVVITIQLNK